MNKDGNEQMEKEELLEKLEKLRKKNAQLSDQIRYERIINISNWKTCRIII